MIVAPLKTIAFLVIAAALNLRVDTGSWKKLSDMPTARMAHSVCSLDGKIYAIGGYSMANSPGVTTVEVYDPQKDTWT